MSIFCANSLPKKKSLSKGLYVQVQEEDYLGGGQTLASGFRVSIQVNTKSYIYNNLNIKSYICSNFPRQIAFASFKVCCPYYGMDSISIESP